jgi:hypothetical protein
MLVGWKGSRPPLNVPFLVGAISNYSVCPVRPDTLFSKLAEWNVHSDIRAAAEKFLTN